MARPKRLVALLRAFGLPADATTVQLRQAYLREAKRLHPDCHVDSERALATQMFVKLQVQFDEATSLLNRPCEPRTRLRQDHCWEPAGDVDHDGPPTVGLEARFVYTAFVSAVACVGLWIFWRTAHASQDRRHVSPAASTAKRSPEREERSCITQYSDATQRKRSLHKVVLSQAHVAAKEGCIWWLECCGASSSCLRSLELKDRRGDTPLHHCARSGNALACRTLLRLGADPRAKNEWQLLPEELADHQGHQAMAHELRAIRLADIGETSEATAQALRLVRRHPDGLGKLRAPPPGIFYDGPHATESLRHAANLAVGVAALRCLHLPGDPQDLPASAPEPGEKALEVEVACLRQQLADTGYGLESLSMMSDETGAMNFRKQVEGGLLVYEPPGVTPYAPGHWHALRPDPSNAARVATRDSLVFWRLDPTRGPYWVTEDEANVLLRRYRAWRIRETE